MYGITGIFSGVRAADKDSRHLLVIKAFKMATQHEHLLNRRYAVLSMDIEDWYHLDYFAGMKLGTTPSLLDGLSIYTDIIDQYNIKASFFMLGELAPGIKQKLQALTAAGHDIGCHGWGHTRPLTMTPINFRNELFRAKASLEDILGKPVLGYRAPCYSLDRQRLDIIRELGFSYDSSKIGFSNHPLYGHLDMTGFHNLGSGVYLNQDFAEFELSTLSMGKRTIPVSGGGYIRIFPWLLMKNLLKRYLAKSMFFILYIHPFELSNAPSPLNGKSVSWKQRLRFSIGRSTVTAKLHHLIHLLQANGYCFVTLAHLRNNLLTSETHK